MILDAMKCFIIVLELIRNRVSQEDVFCSCSSADRWLIAEGIENEPRELSPPRLVIIQITSY